MKSKRRWGVLLAEPCFPRTWDGSWDTSWTNYPHSPHSIYLVLIHIYIIYIYIYVLGTYLVHLWLTMLTHILTPINSHGTHWLFPLPLARYLSLQLEKTTFQQPLLKTKVPLSFGRTLATLTCAPFRDPGKSKGTASLSPGYPTQLVWNQLPPVRRNESPISFLNIHFFAYHEDRLKSVLLVVNYQFLAVKPNVWPFFKASNILGNFSKFSES